MSNLITGLFENHAAAEEAITLLKQRGYTANEISVIMKDSGAANAANSLHSLDGNMANSPESQEVHPPTTSTAGVAGAVIGGLLAVTAVAVPGIGLLAAGALAALFVGGGALTGSAIGWLIDQGIPEETATDYAHGLNEGGIVIAVAAHPEDEQNVAAILHRSTPVYTGA